ncbi:unnamed protein product [Phaedon cochleariae]|uniref:Transmembrane inner ear expressed protein n=1 Tax=Phaedon cochleariae TaxID=80249 RepID=A0A9P0DL77_PHACE|nr:unnamed protein product [Phaedon cochleariae]
MATFYANPDEKNELWIERAAVEGSGGFRIWHYIFFCFSAFTVIVVLTCCCIKIRVPRTKQEIEADYCRKKLAEKFRERLRLIKNQEMDAMDLERALQIIQEDYNNENRNYQFVPSASTNFRVASECDKAQPQAFSSIIDNHRRAQD